MDKWVKYAPLMTLFILIVFLIGGGIFIINLNKNIKAMQSSLNSVTSQDVDCNESTVSNGVCGRLDDIEGQLDNLQP